MLDIQKRLSIGFYALLSLPATAMGFGLAVQISCLSWILSTKYHFEIDEVGFVWLAGPLAGIVGQLLAGYISDRVWFMGGRRRPFIVIGGLVAAGMLFLLPYLDVISEALGFEDILVIALTVALMLDLAINIGFNPTRSIIADVTPDGEARTRGYTIMQTVSGFFGVLAFFIALVFGQYFLIYFGVVLIAAFNLIPIFFIEEPRKVVPDQTIDGGDANQTNIRQLLAIYIAHSFTWLGIQTMFVYLYKFVEIRMLVSDSEEIGTVINVSFLILNSVGFILPALVLEPLAKKMGRTRVHVICLGLMSLAYFLVLMGGGSTFMLYFAMGVAGIGWAAVVSLPFAIMTEYVSKEKTGLYMGIFNLSIVIPQLIVSGILGTIFKNAENLDIIFVICGASLAISSVLWAVLVRDKSSLRPAV